MDAKAKPTWTYLRRFQKSTTSLRYGIFSKKCKDILLYLIGAKPCTTQPIKLAQFVSGSQTKSGIPFSLKDYLELTDWTGRCVRVDKRGSIPSGTPKILDQLSLDSETWLETVNAFSTEFHSFVGPEDKLKALCQKQSKKWVQGIQLCRKLFSNKKLCPI